MDFLDQHLIAVAQRTLEMIDAGVPIIGGMTMDEARAVLKKNGISFEEEEYAR